MRLSLTSHRVNLEIVSIYDYHSILHVFYYITLHYITDASIESNSSLKVIHFIRTEA